MKMNRLILMGILIDVMFLGVAMSFAYEHIAKIDETPEGMMYKYYESISKSFSTDAIILNITQKCAGREDKFECVFYQVPLIPDEERLTATFPLFLSPEEYFTKGGVCRDAVILRNSVLQNLGIKCIFNFQQENHVYLTCPYENKIYELNNDVLSVTSLYDS